MVDDAKWLGGLDALFADNDKRYLPSFLAQADFLAYVNRDAVPASELSSEQQFLDPRWKGKMAIQDPRGGAGLGTLTTMLVAFGEPYVRSLLSSQALIVTGDDRQLAEWLVRARYPIAIGVAAEDVALFVQQGVQARIEGLGAPGKLSGGSGGIQYLSRAPHPNAARVFMNWVLTQSAELRIAQITGSNLRRVDVPPRSPDKTIDAAHPDKYVAHQTEQYLPQRRRAQQLGRELLQ